MCGITGIVNLRGENVSRAEVATMNQTQIHRGPDEQDLYIDGPVGFGHTRLSIIDLADGQQPMTSRSGDAVIVFNGEIYNFKVLREELRQRGHTFATNSDTEVILASYLEYGENCVDHLRGMFAFAIWDRRRRSLFLARDRLGIKPLFYAVCPNGAIAFGSELKSILTLNTVIRRIDPTAVEDYFALGYVPEPKTIFEGVKKLPPGHTLTTDLNGSPMKVTRYWDVPTDTEISIDAANATEELITRLREAVGIRLISEVPLGAFLSGGVDSSAVVAMMSENADKPVTTCSMAFDDPKYDESTFAKMVATRWNTRHFEDQVSTGDFNLVDVLGGLYDEPYADSSAIPTYRVCELARRHVTVALSGDGGDETFAGYRRYRWHMNEQAVRDALPYALRKPVFGALGWIYPKADWAPRIFRAKTTFQSLACDAVNAYLHSVSIVRDAQRSALFSNHLQSELQGYHVSSVFAAHAAEARTTDPLKLIQYLDMKTYLVGDILTKVDRASMAHALEVRVPILDHKFVEWAMSLPSALKLKGQVGKYVLKKSMETKLPNDVLYRSKMGFSVPLSEWFRGQLRNEIQMVANSEAMNDSGLFNMDAVNDMVRQHQSGRREYSAPLWSLLMFDNFLNRELA